MTNNHSKGRAIALLPIAVFLLFFIGSGLITGDFYSMPAIVGFLIALIIAFLQNKKLSFVQKLRLASTGVGDENILTMCLIFLAQCLFRRCPRCRRCRKHRQPRPFHSAGQHGGCRPFRYRLLYFHFYGYFRRHYYRTCSDCCGHQRQNRLPYGYLRRCRSLRCNVR